METTEFISLCDSFFQQYPTTKQPAPNGYERIYAEARSQISDPDLINAAVNHFRQKLIILHHQNGLDFEKYIPVLDSIREASRKGIESDIVELVETNWVNLIHIIIENRGELCCFDRTAPSLLENRLHSFAQSYLRIKSIGVEIVERDYNFYISDKSYVSINNLIDKLCSSYGGENLLSALSNLLGKTYNTTTGRFMEYRHLTMGTTEVHSAIPFGYLVAICSKYIDTKGGGNPLVFNDLVQIITDLIVIFEIQPYSQFEAVHLEGTSLVEFIQKNILYDIFVGIAQAKASYASSLIRYLQGKFSENKYLSLGIGLKDVTRVALALIAISNTKKFTNVNINDIAIKSGLPKSKIAAAMDNILSIPSKTVNANLKFPPSSLNIDHYFKPAIKVGGNYKIFTKSIAALGCLNAVCNLIVSPNGKRDKKLDSELGYAVEDFLRDLFQKKNIKYSHGVRIGGKPDLEADLILETDDTIFIFEVKKKGLTRQAQAGDESTIFADLADSVLASHVQAMKIERELKKNESLTLIYNGTQYTVRLNGRSVQRISVSLSDFGALQDKTVLQRILTIASLSNVSHPVSTEDEKLKKWRAHSEELRLLATENGELGSVGKMPFYNSLFMSIPQIMMILDQSECSDDFFKFIKSFIGMTTGSRDTYTEFLNRLNFVDQCKAEGIAI